MSAAGEAAARRLAGGRSVAWLPGRPLGATWRPQGWRAPLVGVAGARARAPAGRHSRSRLNQRARRHYQFHLRAGQAARGRTDLSWPVCWRRKGESSEKKGGWLAACASRRSSARLHVRSMHATPSARRAAETMIMAKSRHLLPGLAN